MLFHLRPVRLQGWRRTARRQTSRRSPACVPMRFRRPWSARQEPERQVVDFPAGGHRVQVFLQVVLGHLRLRLRRRGRVGTGPASAGCVPAPSQWSWRGSGRSATGEVMPSIAAASLALNVVRGGGRYHSRGSLDQFVRGVGGHDVPSLAGQFGAAFAVSSGQFRGDASRRTLRRSGQRPRRARRRRWPS